MKMKKLIVFLIILIVTVKCPAPDIWMDVDTALSEVPVNKEALVDVTDGYTIEDAIAYNAAGMNLTWNFVTTGAAFSSTAVTPTTGGDYDWAEHDADDGMYTIEIPASGGASINNDTEGFGWFTGKCDATRTWTGPVIGFRKGDKNDLEIDDGTAQTNQDNFFDGSGYVGGTIVSQADVTKWDNSTDGIANWVIVYSTDFTTGYNTALDMWNGNTSYWVGQSDSITNADDFYGNVTAYGHFDDAFDETGYSSAIMFDDLATKSEVVDEWETQSQEDPTGFHVNVIEVGGTAQTGNDNGADINTLLADWTDGGRLDLILDDILEDTAAGGTTTYPVNTTVNTVTSTTIFTLTDGAVANNDAYNNNVISIQDADDNHWEVRYISDFVGASLQVTLNTALTFTPANGDVVHITENAYIGSTAEGGGGGWW
jgi:hypothetical protein